MNVDYKEAFEWLADMVFYGGIEIVANASYKEYKATLTADHEGCSFFDDEDIYATSDDSVSSAALNAYKLSKEIQ